MQTDEAEVPIEAIDIGDRVVALDLETGVTGYFTVTTLFSHEAESLLEVAVGDDLIRVTDEHPFWVVGEGWVGAQDLERGDCVYQLDGSCQPVLDVEEVPVAADVYNFTVVEAHTYFVGAGQWLVHNQCQSPTGKGPYRTVKGHHIHQQVAFKGDPLYNKREALAISYNDMKNRGWYADAHDRITRKQYKLFRELYESGRPNTMSEHNRIAVEALIAGGATREEARDLVAESWWNLRRAGVKQPTRIPWFDP